MFDRIAGFYDLMNSVMTAGLHHRWRERAADLAQRRAGRPRARRRDRHRRPRDRARAPGRARRRGGRLATSPRGCSSARARKAPGLTLASGPTRSRSPIADDGFDAATVGFGARNFSDLDRGLAEMARVVRPGGRVVVLEITTPDAPPLSRSSRSGSTASCRCSARSRRPDAYTYLPNSVKRFPGPAALGGEMAARGAERRRWMLTAGGIIAHPLAGR